MFCGFLQDDGIEVRSGALGLRQLGVAAAHCKLDSFVANFVKVLCGQEIYKYVSYSSSFISIKNPSLLVSVLILAIFWQICVDGAWFGSA